MEEQMTTARKFSIIIICATMVIALIYCVNIVFSRMLRQEIGWFDLPENKIGVLTSRLAVDATIVKAIGGNQLGLVATSASSVFVSLGVAIVASWKLTVVNFLFIPFLIAAVYVNNKNVKENAARTINTEEQGVKIASEAISNIRTVASLTVETKFERKFNSFFDSFMRKERVEAASAGLFYGFSQSLPEFAYALTLFYGAHLVSLGEIEFQDIFNVAVVLMKTSQAIGRATAYAPDAHKARIAAKHIFNLLDRKPQIEIGDGDSTTPPECRGEVSLDDIEFTYPSRPDAITAGSDGDHQAGSAGGARWPERMWKKHRIDGVDIRSLDVQWVRAQLALVSQEPVLFNTTIYDNIAYGDNTRTPTMDEVIDVAKKANIHNFIASLPLGYDTNVGEGGSQLSGGQKQRIAIARALLRNPRILLLDEATSALDTESEKLVQEALERAQEGRTCIVIAHRLSTIRSADKIVVMQEGVVVEEGTHDELMAQESFYYDLVQKQVDALV
ncbi:hypothetical protein NP493_1733g00018 [Ridgeia piscesae]|uniref:Uncharacterized protein n=1 Tax=Ridgeia piscesae TaxID=27915 RepID=A0AAD9JTK0_RIDPI|nr:hypothetical protein NP493_1733g00018 [Ridgeia piscesae]